MLGRWIFDFAVFEKPFYHAFDHASSFIDVGDFPTTKDNRDLHTIFVRQKLDGLFDLKVDIVRTRFGAQTNLFGLCVVRVTLGLLFVLLVFVFAVIHYSANRRFFIGSYLHQIESTFFGDVQRFFGWNNAQLVPFPVNDSNGSYPNPIIDPRIVAIDCSYPSVSTSKSCHDTRDSLTLSLS